MNTKLGRRKAREVAYVQAHCTGTICDRCGATLDTFADQCSAELDDACPGFLVIDAAKMRFNKPATF